MDKPSSPFVATIDLALADKLKQGLLEHGFELSQPPHTVFSGKKKGVSCTLYQSGKLTVQGKESPGFIEFYLEPEILKKFDFTYTTVDVDTTGRIGIDESGKGDFFGPLCIAGVFAEGQAIVQLKALGVRDSKTMSDNTILKIGKKIRAEYAHQIVRINPQKYNELHTQFGRNLNYLLAWGHATAIENLVIKTGCKNVIIDQFAAESVVLTALKRKKLEISLTQRHRGEEDLVVAAASILAREAFLDGLEKMKNQYAMTFPKGASAGTIQAGRDFVRNHGQEALGSVGKLHFKTSEAILNSPQRHRDHKEEKQTG